MRKQLGTAALAAALLATSACGGGSRPSQDDISKALQQKSGMLHSLGSTPGVADCNAKVFVDSNLSDDALQAIVDNNRKFKASKADNKALVSLTPKIQKCVMAGR